MSIFDEIKPVRGLWGDTVTTATNTAADAPGGVFIALRAFVQSLHSPTVPHVRSWRG